MEFVMRCVAAFASALALSVSVCAAGWEVVETPLDGLVGWYEVSPGHAARVTWDAYGGLVFVDIDEPRVNAVLERRDGSFLWDYSSKDDSLDRVARFVVGKDGRATAIEWKDGAGASGVMARVESAGYEQRQVRFECDGLWLAGTVMLPRGEGPFPGAVIIQGSGDSGRENQWAMTIADHLAKSGVAVLFPDKRGVGMSGGDWRVVGFDALARDAAAGMAALRAQRGVDDGRTGFVGLSQGGWVAPLATELMGDCAFVVDVSGTVLTPFEQVRHEVEQDLRRAGMPEPAVARMLGIVNLAAAYARTGEGWDAYLGALEGVKQDPALAPAAMGFVTDPEDSFWVFWRKVGALDVAPVWARQRAPALFVYGAEDETDNVPVARTVERIEAIKANAKSGDVTVRVFPGLGHGLIEPGGWVSAEFLGFVSDWIAARTKE